MISVRGKTSIMDEARLLYPNFMDSLVGKDGEVNTDLRDKLVSMGLSVIINDVVYEPDCGPYCEVDFSSDEDAEEEGEEW